MSSPSARSPEALGEDALVLAVDVGGTTIKGEIVETSGEVLAAAAVPTPRGEAAFDALAEVGDGLLAGLSDVDRARVGRAAVLLPGLVDPVRSIAVFSANIGWRDVEVGARFRDRWSMPVLIEHDVAVAGWAEWRFGAGGDRDTVCVVIIGTGISGTLSVGGRLVRGGIGQAGEYGHIPVRRDHGMPCPCGNTGCVETVASASAIARAYQRRTGRGNVGAAQVFASLGDDADARAVVADAVEALADGLLGVVHAVCPEVIVLGGGLAGAGDALAKPLHEALAARVRVVPVPEVRIGRFGARAGLAGAALFAGYGELL
ncbi:ROK family protein [Nocardia sp. NPDC050406]|uniref:ROK family protein n=1 Tax=Nocardia sp. NPDC050406 TaxID=3364318 RepID=UPI0037992F29